VSTAALRLPLAFDPTAAAYKDWLHVNVLDHDSGTVGLMNVSLHGDPADPRSRAVGTALLHVPGEGWFGNVEPVGFDEARIDTASIALEHVAIAVDADTVLASARLPNDELELELTATFAGPAVTASETFPLGVGWIGWSGVPRLRPLGFARVGGSALDLRAASAYHDHNWGRWHWGDDFGWEWGCFLPPDPAPAFVLTRVTNRRHELKEPSLFVAYTRTRKRWFLGAGLTVTWSGSLAARPRRVPGALAALHHDRATPHLPARLQIVADDGVDRVQIEFRARAVAQVVAADPAQPGCSFIHELVGEFEFTSRLAGAEGGGNGLAVVEYVD
jgi:hypothetical protein